MKEKLLALKLKEELITVNGIKIIVKEMNAGEAAKYENSLYKVAGNKLVYNTEEARLKLFILTAHDENREKMFEIKDIELVKSIPAHVIDAVFTVASKLNGLNKNSKN